MNTCTNATVRSLTSDEIDMIYGGGNPPTPTETYAYTSGNTNYYKFSCPSGYGIVGIQFGQQVQVVQGNIYSGGFACQAGGYIESAIAFQQSGSGGWTDFSTLNWGVE